MGYLLPFAVDMQCRTSSGPVCLHLAGDHGVAHPGGEPEPPDGGRLAGRGGELGGNDGLPVRGVHGVHTVGPRVGPGGHGRGRRLGGDGG